MTSVATAAVFIWLGMVLAISFLEAPLRFRAPGVDLRTGLAIGRLVFRALNAAETILAIIVVACLLVASVGQAAVGASVVETAAAALVAAAVLFVQVVLVRPRLTRRSDRVLAGVTASRSNSHHAYIALEVAKVLALATTGTLLLATT